MKTTKKQSLKKGNPLALSQQYVLDFEHQFKSTQLKVEDCHKNLGVATQMLDDFDRLIENKQLIHLNEANKNFLQIKNSLAKISKELGNLQKSRCKFEADFEQHFETPFLENQFSNKEAEVLEGTRKNIEQIKTGLTQHQHALTRVVDPCQIANRRLAILEERLNKLFLPDQIKEVAKQTESLNERLKSIYDTIARSNPDSPGRAEPHLTQAFLPLSTAYRQEGEWLRRISELSTPTSNPVALPDVMAHPAVIEKVAELRLD